ncbi:hypothetical protein KSP39_PZI017909 [Platanthera zijinensis]|uniref:STICHEL DnaA-N-like alpha-beta domain-containing protein n=1 Tax=Platanthera zijinensis TaxID=2320716 RepID=A0AAP0G047_9ASPA
MAEGRRHSMDIPLSKTLVALQRVRSLRNPPTNSMSKVATRVDNAPLGNSCVGPCLPVSGLDIVEAQNYYGFEHISKTLTRRNYASKKSSIMRPRCSHSKRAILVHQPRHDGTKRTLENTRCQPYTNLMEEEVDSCSGTSTSSESIIHTVQKEKPEFGGWRRTPNAMYDAAMSRAGSPCLTTSELRTSRSTLGLSNADDVDVVNSNYSGCGISYCWSRTPKHKDPTFSSGIEGQELPLLSAEGGDKIYGGIASIPESLRSLSQKYRPRSFNDLVGLNAVSKSLLHAISIGKIAPLYLFHGPRGTGKTSTARIFAAALNCLSLEDKKPCGCCQECVFLFSGRSRDVKELFATKLNHIDRIKSLLKSASLVPFKSQFKVYIIEECHFLRGEIWSAILNNVDDLARHTVFLMITSNPNKLPKTLISQCQRYHFPKVKDEEIVFKLQNICLEEGFVFEKDALSFISSKANGSLQDAETTLDQLALLGKKITLALAHELIGVVSDEELLDLLDLALSADTSNTIRRARDLMASRIDPMQLVSQLANLIMDILSGRYHSEFSDAVGRFFGKHVVARAGIGKLRHALTILSETEKQLRTSKSQATWLTAALLQFSTQEPSPMDVHESIECSEAMLRERGILDSSSARAIQKNFSCYVCSKLNCPGIHCNRAKRESIWRRSMSLIQSSTVRSFLLKEGSLSALHFSEGLAVATIGFCHPGHVLKAEKSWKSIENSFQNVLGCNVDIRIKLLSTSYKKKRHSFSFLSCSGKKQEMSESNMTDESPIKTPMRKESFNRKCASIHGHCFSPHIKHLDETDQRKGNKIHGQSVQAPIICRSESSSSKVVEEIPYAVVEETEIPPSCFARVLQRHKRVFSSGASHVICLKMCSGSKSEFSTTNKGADKAYFLAYDPHNFTPSSNAFLAYKYGEDGVPTKCSKISSRLLCWRCPTTSPR